MNTASTSLIQAALERLRAGGLCIVRDHHDREDEGDFVALGATITAESLNTMVTLGRGLVCTPVGLERARALGLGPMVEHNGDPHGTAFTVSVDGINTGTGISIADRLATIRLLAAPEPRAESLRRPGHIFPLVGRPGGLAVRQGHTEASLDLARRAGTTDCAVICEILAPDGTMLRGPALEALARDLDLPLLAIEDLRSSAMGLGRVEVVDFGAASQGAPPHPGTVAPPGIEASVPSAVDLPSPHGTFRAEALSFAGESLALTMGDTQAWHQDPRGPLVRIHSECLTGDVFGSRRCDCGPQLDRARELIAAEGQGLILYLRQEGRGIGLHQKLKAYGLQDRGLDTVDANRALGHADDLRTYHEAAAWLQSRGLARVRLMTNNPQKVAALRQAGIEVEPLPLVVPARAENRRYLETKRVRMGHGILASP